MELLSYLSTLPTRKSKLVERAQELRSSGKTVKGMEKEMAERNRALVARLRENKIRFSEFQRVAADETITAAVAATMLGRKATELTYSQYAEATKALVYLWKFFGAIQKSLNEGRLENPEFEEPLGIEDLYDMYSGDYTDEELQEYLDQFPDRDLSGQAGSSTPATWNGVESRLGRYLVTPIYGFAAAGTLALNQTLGYREMKRVARFDKKTCEDCRTWDSMGWMPIGILPPPGQRCRCHDNCRCYIDYRQGKTPPQGNLVKQKTLNPRRGQ